MFIPNEHIPLRQSDINLDISGVAGFFGGDVAVSAMATVHIYKGRRWLGWYNSPGSYEIAKRYGQLARARIWGGLYPGVPVDPAALFELDGTVGPRYRAVQSGTIMAKTGHLAHLLLKECKEITEQDWKRPKGVRETSPVFVTVADLHYIPDTKSEPHNARFSSYLAAIPILASAATAVSCAMAQDWLCFSMIVLGMYCSGVSCWIIGRGVFTFEHPKAADGAPPGDGILEGSSNIVILQGKEDAVNAVTRGKFSLNYKSDPSYHDIGISSMLLTAQFLVQLLVVPQGTIFGQVMFLCSLAVSWIYNSYLSSLDKESIQRRILVDQILEKPLMRKYKLGTRTTMVVFVLLVLSQSKGVELDTLRDIMNELLPNDTLVWREWKKTVLQGVKRIAASDDEFDGMFISTSDQGSNFSEKERNLLSSLYTDAHAAYVAFMAYTEVCKDSADDQGPTRANSEARMLEEKDEAATDILAA
ncbi:hypothetical protein C8Q74DRAFT_31675 [Fomes fomentarius]|nr:hypothetical protein C8Q74DRAFT_31675 [Fomes fomentarius]